MIRKQCTNCAKEKVCKFVENYDELLGIVNDIPRTSILQINITCSEYILPYNTRRANSPSTTMCKGEDE